MFHISYLWKLTMDRVGGWSENFWNTASDIATAIKEATQLRPLLKAIHGRQSVNTKVRVAYADGSRAGRLLRFTDAALTPTGDDDSDYVNNSFLLELDGDPGGQTRQWIRGIPDGQIRKGGFMDLNGVYPDKVKAFMTELKSNSAHWALRIIDQDFGTYQLIEGVTDAGIITVPAHGIVGNLHVQIKGVKSPRPLNGVRLVKDASPDTLQLLSLPDWPRFTYKGPGFVRAHAFDFPKCADARFVMATSKETGRPTDLLSGKRKKVK